MADMTRRYRFSVRTLAIVVTLVCAYLGAWEATKKWGVASKAYIPYYGPENVAYERHV
jgi:hypothetical protein